MIFRPILVLLVAGLTGGCAALGSINEASVELDAYTLSPLGLADSTPRNLHLVVQLPTSAGALATDRILIKPSALQAQYLANGRWTDPAPVLVQTLLLASLQNQGGFSLVDRDGSGLMPDFTLTTELQEFQAEPATGAAVTVRVSAGMTLIREDDLSIVATRRFSASAMAQTDGTADLVVAFDVALREVMADIVSWTRAQTGG